MKKITISDVAKASGYTKSSVSCALNGKKGVGENARKKIMKIADELGYTPNAYAQSISLGSSNTIGVILRDISNPFYANVFCAINEVAEEKNYQTLFYSLFDNPDRVQKGINLFKGKMLSGLIIDYFEQDQEMIKKIYELGIPTVIFGQFVDADICCVEADDVNGVDQAIDYIIKNGFKNVYYITHKSYDVYNDRRKKTIKDRMHYHNEKFSDEENIIFVDKNSDFANDIINKCEKNSVLICYNDILACKCISQLMKRGLYVPKDYSIIGFDNLDIVPYSLTTIDIPKYEMARKACYLLFEQIEKKQKNNMKIRLKSNLIIRDSVRLDNNYDEKKN